MRRLKKWAGLQLVWILAACGGPDLKEESGQSGLEGSTPVRLVYADTVNLGCSTCLEGRGFIDVQNIAYRKDVKLVYSHNHGDWRWLDASYARSLDDSRELWSFRNLPVLGETRFAIRYDVDGRDHWDNNDRRDYRLGAANSGRGRGVETVLAPLGPGRDIAVLRASVGGRPTEEIVVDFNIRNRSFHKSVYIRVTVDRWASYEDFRAAFDCPLGGEVERWRVRAPVPAGANELEFAAWVEMDGNRSWDNGFRRNFKCQRSQDAFADWRCYGSTLL